MDDMDVDQIGEYIEPYAKEMFDAYLLVGFRANDHKIAMIGDLGHPKTLPELNRKLRPIYKECRKLVRDEEDKKGMDLL